MRSVSILSNIALNFGLLVCMRLLLASAMFNASMRISVSLSLNVTGLFAMVDFLFGY